MLIVSRQRTWRPWAAPSWLTEGILQEFGPDRILDTPISEILIAGAGVGLALAGMKPICEMQFMDFISCAFDQIVNMAGTARYRHGGSVKASMVVRGLSGGGVHGALFHSQNPEAWFTRVPGLKVVCPGTVWDARGLMKAAIRDPNPVIFFEHKRLYRSLKADLPDQQEPEPLGTCKIQRAGEDLTIVTYGGTVTLCLTVADALAQAGVSAEIVDLRTLRPLDFETIRTSVKKTSKLLIVHEDRRIGGIGADICSRRGGGDVRSRRLRRFRSPPATAATPFHQNPSGAAQRGSRSRIRGAKAGGVLEDTAMPTNVVMPQLANWWSSGAVVKWRVKEGDSVKRRRSDRGGRDRQGHHRGAQPGRRPCSSPARQGRTDHRRRQADPRD